MDSQDLISTIIKRKGKKKIYSPFLLKERKKDEFKKGNKIKLNILRDLNILHLTERKKD